MATSQTMGDFSHDSERFSKRLVVVGRPTMTGDWWAVARKLAGPTLLGYSASKRFRKTPIRSISTSVTSPGFR